MHLLVANRGEIAVRIVRAARELGVRTTAVHAADDAGALHTELADDAVALPGEGPPAYLDQAAVLAAAHRSGAAAVHPGYGFLSESAEFAQRCADEGIAFVGPSPEVLRTFGDKQAAREAARAAGVPVLPATSGASEFAEVAAFFAEQPGGIMLKAQAGGGGRGMRAVRDRRELDEAYRRCAAEAAAGFGSSAVFAERLLPGARHVEVQVLGDGRDVVALGDRDCSVQRRHQKLVEIAPAPLLDQPVREALASAAVSLARGAGYRGLGTVEFLVRGEEFCFLEVNPRIQVEHTVTEEVTGLDLVALQLRLAEGAVLADLDLPAQIPARGTAIQARVNLERIGPGGEAVPAEGTITAFSPPTGAGVRVETAGRAGMRTTARYDSLLAKVVVHSRAGFAAAADKARRALAEFTVSGVATNRELLLAVLGDPEFTAGGADTDYLARNAERFAPEPAPADDHVVTSPLTGQVVEICEPGRECARGAPVAVVEAMKMQHTIPAPRDLRAADVLVAPGEAVAAEQPLLTFTAAEASAAADRAEQPDPDAIRPDLAEVRERHAIGLDAARPAAVGKRHARGRRTARENIADLVDEGGFVEYGPLVVAAQRGRRSEQDLRENTPGDGLVAGIGRIGGDRFERSDAVVLSYDYTVLAGTQGVRNHAKTDRLLDLARRKGLPVFFFPEGGGGRPGDVDSTSVSGLDVETFHAFGALSGRVPLIGIVSGRCFAGNAAILGMCDVIIATPDANIGMGGPAMVEGGGLGSFAPEEIGPVAVQRRNGVVDLVAEDEADAVRLAKQCFAFYQGAVDDWEGPDPRLARCAVPENRMRAYDVRTAVRAVSDVDSVVELRPDHAPGMVTCLVRVEGRPCGLIANDPQHLGGAIDVAGARKLEGFLALCESWRLPVVSFCDTPGFMVGPESEEEGAARAFSRLFVAGAGLTVPFGTVVLRKGYGLGAQAMAAGSFRAPEFVVAWPTGEIGAMGLEGAVRLGYRKELEAIDDPQQRRAAFDAYVAAAYADGKATHAATVGELDDVIDPADTRRWITTLWSRA